MALPSDQQIIDAGAAEQAANKAVGEAALAGGEAEQAAEDNAAAVQLQHETELRAQADRHSEALTRAKQETEEAFKTARDTKMGDFWGGSTGRKLFTSIAVGLGGAASILAHQNGNSTYDIVRSQMEDHFRNEKQKIDQAFKFAEAKGKLTDDMRLQYAQELADLQTAHAAANASAAAKIRAIAAQSKGRIDAAKADATASALEQDTLKSLGENTKNRAQIGLLKAQTAEEYARAKSLNEGKIADRESKLDKVEIDRVEKVLGKTATILEGTAGRPGPKQVWSQLRSLGDEIRAASASGDPQELVAAMIAAKEKVARLNTGAAPSHEQMKLLNAVSGTPAEWQEKINKLTGNPAVAKQTADGILKLIDNSENATLQQIDRIIASGTSVAQGARGEGGLAKRKATQEYVQDRLRGMVEGITTRTDKGEIPRYEYGGKKEAMAQANAQATATATPDSTAEGKDTDLVEIVSSKGTRKTVTRKEARALGAIK